MWRIAINTDIGPRDVGLNTIKPRQVRRGSPVEVDRLQGRTQAVRVVIQPALLQLGDRERLEAQRCRSADLHL